MSGDSADGPFKWIGHFIDHFSKYHVLFPLRTKEASEVAENLINHVFRYFGLPYILQSDNGKEFTAKVIEEVVQRWPGRCVIVRGRPYHPQSQGCVEKGHTSVKSMICTRRVDNGSGHWASWLGSIQCKSILLNKLLYMDYYQQSIVRPFIVYTNILIVLCS